MSRIEDGESERKKENEQYIYQIYQVYHFKVS